MSEANKRQIGGTHYKTAYNHWDLVIVTGMGYLAGCSTKYVSRWRKAKGIQDLEKAEHYLQKLMEVETYERILAFTEEMQKEVERFVEENNLTTLEGEYIYLLCAYQEESDLKRAQDIVNVLIQSQTTINRIVDEVSDPGTPE